MKIVWLWNDVIIEIMNVIWLNVMNYCVNIKCEKIDEDGHLCNNELLVVET